MNRPGSIRSEETFLFKGDIVRSRLSNKESRECNETLEKVSES